jgi:hypothetical protein
MMGDATRFANDAKARPMLSDTVKYWFAVLAIMLLMWGYTGKLGTALMFGIAGAGAFVYWRLIAARRKRASDARHEQRPHGA